MIAACIRFHDARVNRKPFALHKPPVHARPDYRLEQQPKDVTIPEAPVSID